MSENEKSSTLDKALVASIAFSTCVVLGACLIIGIFATGIRNQIPVVKDLFPTHTPTIIPTPTQTPIPQILVQPPTDAALLKDEFKTNENDWSTYYTLAKVEIQNEKLTLESFDPGIAIAHCFCKLDKHLSFANKYYLQADVSTENPTQDGYGLIFGLTDDAFYEFSIDPRAQRYYLYKRTDDGWIRLFSKESKIIKFYPEVNTLSVHFDEGTIKLFINGKEMTTYIDKNPLDGGEIGFIVDEVDMKLLADNLFAFSEE